MTWQPTAGGRRPMLTCSECGASVPNESNRLHRDGWQETAERPAKYRCGACAETAEMLAMIAGEPGGGA